MARKITVEIITAMLALLFVYAAVSKLIDFKLFRFQLGRAPYFGKFAGLLAYTLPVAELTIVALLYLNKTKLLGLWASFISMVVFTAYVGLLLLSSEHLPCTCGGLIQKLTWPQHFIFNILFSVISFIGILLFSGKANENKVDYNSYRFAVNQDR